MELDNYNGIVNVRHAKTQMFAILGQEEQNIAQQTSRGWESYWSYWFSGPYNIV